MPAASPHPEPPHAELVVASKDLVALHARLRATLLNCCAYTRDPWGKFGLVPHNELLALNADLEAVRRINAGLRHPNRSAQIPAWPVPVFRTNVLMGPRDLVSVLETATHVLSGAIHASAEPAYA
jgi:hypothetical protein